jgi:WD40 repeat protein
VVLSLPLTALLCAAAVPAAAPADQDKKPAEAAPGPAPEGPRLRLGSGHFRHGGGLLRIYPLPDGKRLLTIATDSRARVWDIAAEKQLLEITLATEPGYIVFSPSPDGKSLAVASTADRAIRAWSLADGKPTWKSPALAPGQEFADLEYSPDSKLLLSAHPGGVFRVWDAAAGKELRRLGPPDGAGGVNALSATFFPDGRAAAVIEGWAVRALDIQDGKELRWFGGHTAPVARLAFSADGRRMATVGSDRAARVWDLASGQTVAKLSLPLAGGSDVAFTPDGQSLAVCCFDGAVRLFDLDGRDEARRTITVGATGPRHLALSRDGKALYVGGTTESVVRGYDVATGKELYPVVGHVGAVTALAWSPDGKVLASAGHSDRSVILWDPAGGRMIRRLPALEAPHFTTILQFAPDGQALLSYGGDRTLRAWDVARGQELRSFTAAPLPPQWVSLSGDGRLAAVATADRKVRVWDTGQGKALHVLGLPAPTAPGGSATGTGSLLFAGDNRTLLVQDPGEGVTRRYDALTGRELDKVGGITTRHGSLPAPSADRRTHILSTGRMTSLVETATGQVRQAFAQPPSPPAAAPSRLSPFIVAAAVSPDGRTVATATSDDVLRFWDTGSGRLLAERKVPLPNTRLLAFAPDGKTLASAGPDTGPLLWDVPGPAAEGRFTARPVTAAGLGELWQDLEGENAARAWQAMLALASAPKEALPLVKKQLDAMPGAKQVARWIADLDADEFAARERASEELIRAGPAAEGAVKKALASKPSAEARRRLDHVLARLKDAPAPSRDEVRAARAVELLERIGTAEARRILEEAAAGASGPWSAEARSALERLKGRDPAP